MPSFASIAPEKLARLLGTPKAPIIIDVRESEALSADPRLIPTSVHLDYATAQIWAPAYRGQAVAVSCQRGKKLAEGAAAWLRHFGAEAEVVDGGFEGWRDAGLPLVPVAAVPKPSAAGSTVWVTRSRPKVDRIACPWLIRRFVDPKAVFLFVAPAEVEAVADRFGATPFDVENVKWSHRGELCTFDVMVEEFSLGLEPLKRLARIVRAADTAQLDLEPEAAGLLAVSLGLSRMYADDLEQLEAGMPIYDALYRWCRDASEETHDWPSAKPRT
ncbi:MAG: chromate resistance protein [Devosia sp.]|nr:chromate resistance protein [Devosia sp.]